MDSITRRTFLATGIAVGISGVANAQQTSSKNDYLDALLKWSQSEFIGDLNYIQIHASEQLDFNTALSIVEKLTVDHRLTQVSAVGQLDLANKPSDVMAGLYYDKNLRATISTLPTSRDFLGTILGTEGTLRLYAQKIMLLDSKGVTSDSAMVSSGVIQEDSATMPIVAKALSEGKTIQI